MKFFLILIAFCLFFVTVDAVYLKISTVTKSLVPIDVRTYFLPSTPKTNYAVWVRSDPSAEIPWACDTEVDAQYISSVSLYTIQDWFRSEHDYGDDGAILFEYHIIDLQSFVAAGFAANIWEHPKSCKDTWDRLSDNILNPLVRKLGRFSHEEIIIQENGISLEIHCKTRDDVIRQRYCQDHNNFGCETSEIIGYHLCTADTFLKILQAVPNQSNFKFF